MDQETQDLLNEGDIATKLINSEEWKWARGKLTALMQIMDSIQTLPNSSDKEIGEVARGRKAAQSLVLSWIQEVENYSTTAKAVRESMEQTEEPMVIQK